jgi:hypothetical protein
MVNGACQMKTGFWPVGDYCWPKSNQKYLHIAGGDAGAVYKVELNNGQTGIHVGGTMTEIGDGKGSGANGLFTVYLCTDSTCTNFTQTFTPEKSGNSNDILCNYVNNQNPVTTLDCTKNGFAGSIDAFATEHWRISKDGCKCDAGYAKQGNSCTLVSLTPNACYYPSSPSDIIVLKNMPSSIYGVPYKACYNSDCIDFIAGEQIPLQYSTPVSGPVTIALNRPSPANAPVNPSTGSVTPSGVC